MPDKEGDRLTPPLPPPEPPKKSVRIPTRLDLNPPAIAGLAIAALILIGGTVLWIHPALAVRAVAALRAFSVAPRRESPVRMSDSTDPESDRRAPVAGAPGVALERTRDKQPMASKKDSDLEAVQVVVPDQVSPDASRNKEEEEKVLDLQRQAKEEQDRLQVIREQADREARERAEAEAHAERDARERAEAETQIQREARAKAEAVAQAEREARDRVERQAADRAKEEVERVRNYSGPRFGTLVWEGNVKGTELITIDKGHSSSGSVVGGLPGLPVLVQPLDPKKVGIASSPGPRNDYMSLVFRVTGNGPSKVTIRWTLP
jgi:hypothetical protein